MEVTFWGVRGSIPAPMTPSAYRSKLDTALARQKAAEAGEALAPSCEDSELEGLQCIVGGNTPCVEINAGDVTIVLDMGTGLREYGIKLMSDLKKGLKVPKELHIFISHTHWDHIQGFPFFQPAFSDAFRIYFYSPHGNLINKLRMQQEFAFFPVSLDFMNADKQFLDFPPESKITIGDVVVTNTALHHPGISYSFRITYAGKSVVYATDGEYNNLAEERVNRFIEHFHDADLLIFDAMYTLDQEAERVDWGHSSPMNAIDIAAQSHAKILALFHHDPENDDNDIIKMYRGAKEYLRVQYPNSSMKIIVAKESNTVEV